MRVIVVSECATRTAAARQAALAEGLACGPDDCVPYHGLPARLSTAAADLVLVDATDDSEAEAAIEYAARTTGLSVFAVGPAADAQHVLRTLRRGAKAYLDANRLGPDLRAALPEVAPAVPRGSAVVVLAAVPGVGTTTVAATLAFALADGRRRVALAEFGSRPPALAFVLAVTPRHTPADLAAEGPRVDAAMARQATVPHPAGVHVLAHRPDCLCPPLADPVGVRHTAAALRTAFDVAVFDLGHGREEREAALPLADAVVVVARADVPGVRLTKLLLDTLAADGLSDRKLHVVVNRLGQPGQLRWRDVEAGIGRPVAAWVPDAPAAVARAAARGRPLTHAAPWSRAARRLGRLAKSVHASFTSPEGSP